MRSRTVAGIVAVIVVGVLAAGTANAGVIALTGDVANTSPDADLHHSSRPSSTALLNLTNGVFPWNGTPDGTPANGYNPASPTNPLPYMNAAHFHGGNTATVTAAFTFDGTYDSLFIDLYGKNGDTTRNDN